MGGFERPNPLKPEISPSIPTCKASFEAPTWLDFAIISLIVRLL